MKKQIFSKILLGLFVLVLSSTLITQYSLQNSFLFFFVNVASKSAIFGFAGSVIRFYGLIIPLFENVFAFFSFLGYIFAFVLLIAHVWLSDQVKKNKIILNVLIVIILLIKVIVFILPSGRPLASFICLDLLHNYGKLYSMLTLFRYFTDIIILLLKVVSYIVSLVTLILYFKGLNARKGVKVTFAILLSIGLSLVALTTFIYSSRELLVVGLNNIHGGMFLIGDLVTSQGILMKLINNPIVYCSNHLLSSWSVYLFCLLVLIYVVVYTIVESNGKLKLIVLGFIILWIILVIILACIDSTLFLLIFIPNIIGF